MAIAVYFHPASMNAAKYDEIIQLLEDAGAGSPKGRLHHSSFGPDSALMVYDIWESQAAFDKFGETLTREVPPGLAAAEGETPTRPVRASGAAQTRVSANARRIQGRR